MHLIKLRQTPRVINCLSVTHSIIIHNSQSQFTISFCMKHINHSLLSCLNTVSPRVNNNSF